MAIAPSNNYYSPAGATAVTITDTKSVAIFPRKRYIPQDFKIRLPETTVVVITPFFVDIAPTETKEDYIATDSFSAVYELAATPTQALKSHLEALADELAWLQKNEKSLSPSILEELHHLQRYIRIV